MKKENFVKFFAKFQALFEIAMDFVNDCLPYHGEKIDEMPKDEIDIYATLIFCTFTMSLLSFIFALPFMVSRGYTLATILITFLTIGMAIPAIIMVVMGKFYWLFFFKLNLIFERYSMPLIGQKKKTQILCRVQNKVFTLLMSIGGAIFACYILLKATEYYLLEIFNVGFSMALPIISWIVIGIMAIDGIFMCGICCYEFWIQLLTYANLKKFREGVLGTIQRFIKTTFTKKQKYVPKRLAPKSTSSSGKIFSLKNLTRGILVSRLSAKANSV